MNCPRCGSEYIRIQIVSEMVRTAECQSCGYMWQCTARVSQPPEGINAKSKRAAAKVAILTILFIGAFLTCSKVLTGMNDSARNDALVTYHDAVIAISPTDSTTQITETTAYVEPTTTDISLTAPATTAPAVSTTSRKVSTTALKIETTQSVSHATTATYSPFLVEMITISTEPTEVEDNQIIIIPIAVEDDRIEIIQNKSTKVYHLNPNCRAVGQMYDENKEVVIATREEVESQGYRPCSFCAK